MNAPTVVAILRGKIREAESAGASPETGITLQSIDRLVSAIESDVAANPPLDLTSATVAQAQLQQASDLAAYRAEVDDRLEVFRSVITSATLAIKSLTLVNGGSAVALLAFIGHLATGGDPTNSVTRLATPLICFVAGAGCAALTAVGVCLAQKSYSQKWSRTGHGFVVLSMMVGAVSLVCFFLGSSKAYPVFRDMNSEALRRKIMARSVRFIFSAS